MVTWLNRLRDALAAPRSDHEPIDLHRPSSWLWFRTPLLFYRQNPAGINTFRRYFSIGDDQYPTVIVPTLVSRIPDSRLHRTGFGEPSAKRRRQGWGDTGPVGWGLPHRHFGEGIPGGASPTLRVRKERGRRLVFRVTCPKARRGRTSCRLSAGRRSGWR